MTNLSQQNIENEFRRQVYLCGGIGKKKMLEIISPEEFVNIPEIKEWLKSDENIRECLSIVKVGADQGNPFEGFRRAIAFVFAKVAGQVD